MGDVAVHGSFDRHGAGHGAGQSGAPFFLMGILNWARAPRTIAKRCFWITSKGATVCGASVREVLLVFS